jgi:DNA polymerase family A
MMAMNLVSTFEPPPPAMFWRMSYFDKTKMRLNFPDSNNQKTQPTSIKSSYLNPSTALNQKENEVQNEISNDISVFGGEIMYDKGSNSSISQARQPDRILHAVKSNGKLLSNLMDDDSRPKNAADLRKRKSAEIASTSGRESNKAIVNTNDRYSRERNVSLEKRREPDAKPSKNFEIDTNTISARKIDSGNHMFSSNNSSNNNNSNNSSSSSSSSRRSNQNNMNNNSNSISSNNSNSKSNSNNNSNNNNLPPDTIPIVAGNNKKNKGSSEEVLKTKPRKLKDTESSISASGLLTAQSRSEGTSSAKFQKSDFAGIGSFCRNAGSTKEGLETFMKKASASESFAVSVIWSPKFDSASFSNNHSTSTVKYCTPSVSCRTWYCSCDRHIRVQQAFEPLLGAVILFPDELQHLYFLPLAKCIESDPSNTGSGSGLGSGSGSGTTDSSSEECVIPLNSKTSLEERWLAFLRILQNKESKKIIYNFQLALLPIFAACYGLREGFKLDSDHSGDLKSIRNVFDPRVAAYVCETDTQESGFEFSSLCNKFNITVQEIPQKDLGFVSQAVGRCHAELKAVLQLKDVLQVELERREGSYRVFHVLEMPLVPLLSLMELRGLEISQKILGDISDKIDRKIAALILDAHQIVGQFNLASPEQVANILYTELKLPTSNTSAKGRHSSTSEEDLLKIRTLHPVVDMILSFRSLSKVSTTYIAGLKPFLLQRKKKITPLSAYSGRNSTYAASSERSDVPRNFISGNYGIFDDREKRVENRSDHENGNYGEINCRVHANWNHTTVRTGRLSCCRPNLQNIPNRQTVGDIEIVVREAFKASQG